MLTAHPIAPGRADQHRQWCAELRERRDEFDVSRRAVGLDRVAVWSQPTIGLAVIRLDGDDPLAALRRLDESASPFDQWYRTRENEVHDVPLHVAATAPTTLVADHVHTPVDPFDPSMAMAVPLLPGRTDDYLATMQLGLTTGRGPAHARDWGVNRLTIHLQRFDDRDLVLYEVAGDLARMVRELSGHDTPGMRLERRMFRDYFGIDVAAGALPLPEPAFAWSAPPTR